MVLTITPRIALASLTIGTNRKVISVFAFDVETEKHLFSDAACISR